MWKAAASRDLPLQLEGPNRADFCRLEFCRVGSIARIWLDRISRSSYPGSESLRPSEVPRSPNLGLNLQHWESRIIGFCGNDFANPVRLISPAVKMLWPCNAGWECMAREERKEISLMGMKPKRRKRKPVISLKKRQCGSVRVRFRSSALTTFWSLRASTTPHRSSSVDPPNLRPRSAASAPDHCADHRAARRSRRAGSTGPVGRVAVPFRWTLWGKNDGTATGRCSRLVIDGIDDIIRLVFSDPDSRAATHSRFEGPLATVTDSWPSRTIKYEGLAGFEKIDTVCFICEHPWRMHIYPKFRHFCSLHEVAQVMGVVQPSSLAASSIFGAVPSTAALNLPWNYKYRTDNRALNSGDSFQNSRYIFI
ncbi:hypothetical protein B0H19DRAFT_1308228 [Mycena capillaripes]|nr:hypothetical protein B0H19DRAFT_1308228 [Mycena capillaripes]